MILPDVNVLIYAYRQEAPEYSQYRGWLDSAINGPERFGISHQVLSSFIRIVTNPVVFPHVDALPDAIRFCESLLEAANCQVIEPGPEHWTIFTDLCRSVNARGNLVADAWLAALAIESDCEWITNDRDFARFPGLRWRTPF